MSRLLLDTCILIDHVRLHPPAVGFVRGLRSPPSISSMTVAELYVGARSEGDRDRIETLSGALRVLPVDAEVAKRGGSLRRQYRDSHGLDLIDALIAATAELNNLRLVTRNIRHFPMLDRVLVPYA